MTIYTLATRGVKASAIMISNMLNRIDSVGPRSLRLNIFIKKIYVNESFQHW